MNIGFLHTSPVHVEPFNRLVADVSSSITASSVVDVSLLDDARERGGVDGDVRRRIESQLAALVDADVIVCTCSTIGDAAEAAGAAIGRRVVRVDRAMAESAVATGGRLAVIAALESTLEPTAGLLQEVGHAEGVDVDVSVHLVEGAWDHFEAGELDAYAAVIAQAVEGIARDADVVVLAQASMAAAANLADVEIPVLSSPVLAVQAAVQMGE